MNGLVLQCEACGFHTTDRDSLLPAQGFMLSCQPGDVVPYGECPKCGGEVHAAPGQEEADIEAEAAELELSDAIDYVVRFLRADKARTDEANKLADRLLDAFDGGGE